MQGRSILWVSLVGLLLLCTGCNNASTDQGVVGPNTVVMSSSQFNQGAITINQGETITFLDRSETRALHILVPGKDGQQLKEPGVPDFGGNAGHKAEQGSAWTTPPWNTPGTFHVTCTVHPAMNLTVSVVARGPTPSPTNHP